MMHSSHSPATLPPIARSLGYAGLLPQIIALALVMSESEYTFVALAGGFAYAALIFSFLGGVWWGQAVSSNRGGGGAFVLAILPSLIGLALFMPWTLGWQWPVPSLVCIGAALAMSPVIDRLLGLSAKDFMRLRWHLSLGLGGLTIALGYFAPAAA
jgi:hypothetical protein